MQEPWPPSARGVQATQQGLKPHTSADAFEWTLPQQPHDQVLGIRGKSFVSFRPHDFI